MNTYAGTYRSPLNNGIILAYVTADDSDQAREKLTHFGNDAKIKCGGASLDYILQCGFVQIGSSGVYI